MTGLILAVWLVTASIPIHATEYIELPVLAAIGQNNLGVFELMLMGWDRKADPNPIQLQMTLGGVLYGKTHLGSMAQAFDYAIERTPGILHTGTVSVRGVTYRPAGSDGPSAGAAMAVGFIGIRWLRRFHARALVSGGFVEWVTERPAPHHIAGAALFGLGWAITDSCPAPIAGQLAQGVWWSIALALRPACSGRVTPLLQPTRRRAWA